MRKRFEILPPEENVMLATALESINHLSSLMECGNIDMEIRASLNMTMKKEKEKFVNNIHPFKISYLESKKYYYTKVRLEDGTKKNITATTTDLLIDKLFEFYGGSSESTVLADLVNSMLAYNKGTVTDKTLSEYRRLWNTYYSKSPLAKKKIGSITYDMWLDFLIDTIRKDNLSHDQTQQMLIVANKIITYCIRKRLMNFNPIRDILQNDLPYRKEAAYNNVKARPFTDGELEKVLECCKMWLKKKRTVKIYPLAIMINCRIGLRIGELRGLCWEDIDFEKGCVTIQRQVVNSCETDDTINYKYSGTAILDHLKACENPRTIPLTEYTLDLFRKVKELNIDGPLIFPMRYHTYNDKIKDAATYAGITVLKQIRSHSLRVTAATHIYKMTKSVKTTQAFLGHTTPEMTMKYIKGLDAYDELVGLWVIGQNVLMASPIH